MPLLRKISVNWFRLLTLKEKTENELKKALTSSLFIMQYSWQHCLRSIKVSTYATVGKNLILVFYLY